MCVLIAAAPGTRVGGSAAADEGADRHHQEGERGSEAEGEDEGDGA